MLDQVEEDERAAVNRKRLASRGILARDLVQIPGHVWVEDNVVARSELINFAGHAIVSFERVLSTLASGEWIQNRRRNRSFAVIWGLLAAGYGFCVYLLVGAIRNDQILGVFVILAAFSPLAVHAGWYAFGSARAGLMITHDAVIIRNPLRKREVPVQDVARFTAGKQPAEGVTRRRESSWRSRAAEPTRFGRSRAKAWYGIQPRT